MTAQIPPGWHPDPTPGAQGLLRYWDGTQWTEHVHADPAHVATPATPADWYPDPADSASGRLRYWDGSQWTNNFHTPEAAAVSAEITPGLIAPVAQTPSPAAEPRERRRAPKWVLGAVAAVAVVGIAVAGIGVVRYLNRVPECGTLMAAPALDVPVEQISQGAVVCTDSTNGFDYTAPARDLEDRAVIFEFDATVDHASPPAATDVSESEAYNWGFKVFADPGLSIELPILVDNNPEGEGWIIDSFEAPLYDIYYPEDDPRSQQFENATETVQLRDNAALMEVDGVEYPTYGQWGLRDTYYLVRYVDNAGLALDRPVVSEFGFTHQLETPVVKYGNDPESPGSLELSWREVDGARVYAIIKAYNNLNNGEVVGFREYEIVGFTEELSWSANEALRSGGNEGWHEFYASRQNASLELYVYGDDRDVSAEDYDGYDLGQFEYGVIALTTDDEGSAVASAYAGTNARDIAGHNVHEIAENTFIEEFGGNTYFGTEFSTIDEIPTTVPIISLDGQLRDHTAVLVAGTVLDASGELGPGWFQVGLFAAGTRLGVPILLPVPDDQNVLTLIEEFNERSASEAAPTGDMYTTMGLFVLDDATILSTAPSVDYPVQGSHAFVEFLATHMVARSEAVDIGPWLDQPGLPDPRDAVYEAMDQNPYQYVQDFSVSGDVVYFTYAYESDVYEQHQQELRQSVQAAVASVVNDGMSQSAKATAINNYLVRQADYDFGALSAMENWTYEGTGMVWREYALQVGALHAWEANGAWSPGVFVCYGYSMAFLAMAMEAGLDAVVVTGPMTNLGGGHAWNKVVVDGSWLGLDVTWNDGRNGNQLLLISDSQWGNTRAFGDRAARSEDQWWVVDANQPLFATP